MERLFKGFLGVVFGAFLLLLAIGKIAGCMQEQADKAAQERIALELDNKERQRKLNDIERKEREAVATKRKEIDKEEKLKLFALSEAPKIWGVCQQMRAAIAEQDGRIRELKGVLTDFGKNPQDDDDYKEICALREEMDKSLCAIMRKLEDAYLASCKFKAMPNRVEYSEIMRKAIEEGVDEATATAGRYNAMMKDK